MLEKEVEYRLMRFVLTNLVGENLISDEEAEEVNTRLPEDMDPPFRTVEVLGAKIGDGVRVIER